VARLHFVRASYKVDLWKTVTLLREITDDTDAVNAIWETARTVDDQLSVEDQPRQGVPFAPLPAPLCNARTYSTVNKQLANFLYRQHTLTLWKSTDLKQISEPGETEGDFRIRLVQLAKEERDREAEKLRGRYADKLATLQDRIRRAQQRVDREKSQYRSHQWQSAISVGTSILGALFGRKLASKTNVTSAGSAFRSLGRAAEQHGDIGRAADSVEALQAQLDELEAEFAQELREVQQPPRADQLVLEALEVRPRKSDIGVEKCMLLWTPWRVDSLGIAQPAY
jgi:hypothetical protein